MTRFRLQVFADHHQLWLHDGNLDSAEADIEELWSAEARRQRLALTQGLIAIQTARAMKVPLELRIVPGPPNDDLSRWDAVLEAGILVPSGQIVVTTTTSDWERGQELIDVEPGCYLARVYFGGQETVTSDLQGKDHYKVVLWPVFQYVVRILKRWRSTSGNRRAARKKA